MRPWWKCASVHQIRGHRCLVSNLGTFWGALHNQHSDSETLTHLSNQGTSLSGTWLQYGFNCCANQQVWIRNRSTDINQLLDLPRHVFKPLSICHDLTERNLILASVISLLCSFVHSCQSIPLTCSTAYMAHDPNIATCEYHAIYDTPSCCLKGGWCCS